MSFAKNAVTALVFSAMVPAVCAKSLIVGGDFSTSFSGEAEAEFLPDADGMPPAQDGT